MPQSVKYMDLPFDEAIKSFRQKVNLPTETWQDIWQGMHSRAFVVAGAMKTDLLSDLFAAVDKGISEGTTLAEFRRDFDNIIEKHGWSYKGGKGWRTAVIFNTNLSVAYATGHYERRMNPDVLRARPYLRYVASSAKEPRREHRQWYNLVLPADHEFWKTHTPPNGWGCKCGVVSHSAREMERLIKDEADGEYPIRTEAPPDEYYDWVDKNGEIHRIPKGIDPGWAYNPGEAAFGTRLSEESMAAWQAQGAAQWERLTPGDWETAGLPEMIPADRTTTRLGPTLGSVDAVRNRLEQILEGPEKTCSFKANNGFRYDMVVNAETLAEHMDLNRSAFLPFIPETLEDPHEAWLSFERNKGTGKVVLRQRVIKSVQTGKAQGMLAVFQSKNGWMEAWTVVPSSDFKYINKQRSGKLIWKRGD